MSSQGNRSRFRSELHIVVPALCAAVFTCSIFVVVLPTFVSPELNLSLVYSPLLMLLLVSVSLREYEVEEHTTGDLQPRRFEELPN